MPQVSKKRKSTGGIEDSKPRPTKQPRKTLDSFFSTEVLASPKPSGNNKENVVQEYVALNDEQIRVLKMVVEEEKSVFFTGSAGTSTLRRSIWTLRDSEDEPIGTRKSLLLRAIINALRKKHAKKPDVVSVTASTGMAASNIGGEYWN